MDARTFRLGIAFAVGSALTFGMSGPFAKALMAAGWTPNAAVSARLAGGALVMALVATLMHRKTVVVYGLIPIAGRFLAAFVQSYTYLATGCLLGFAVFKKAPELGLD